MALAAGTLALVQAGRATAEPMDPALERLVVDARCRTPGGAIVDDPATIEALQSGPGGRGFCVADRDAFTRLVNQFGFAFAPTAMHSARTTGWGGFHVSIEADYTKIDDDADHWRRGTRGPVDPSSKGASVINDSPQPILSLYSVKLRKGFPFGLELTGQVGFMPKTSLFSGGADVRVSLFEGFRRGIPAAFPDLAVGGGVRTVTGSPQLHLTIAGLDAQISKPLAIAQTSVLTPWIGYQHLWIFANSGTVDFTPQTDAIGYCNYAGQNVPDSPGGDPDRTYDGQPVCAGGTGLDFNNSAVFPARRLERHRLLFGINYRYETLMLGGEFITDLVAPADAQNSDDDAEALDGEPRQWTIALELGAMF